MSTAQEPRGTKTVATAPLVRDHSDELRARVVSMWLYFPAAAVSLVFHVGIIVALLFLLPAPSVAEVKTEPTKEENTVQDQEALPEESKDKLLNTEVDPAGSEPDIKINYNLDRKDEVSVPGVVNPDDP